ncbi:hypothetical protein UVI_02046200 [Ustilaginoidea virens]|uniref:Uncharacterized protein n=1 Tax=Ustilaginoidea virens TaxID=1159556 RepID=A0A1B5L0M0_USTVR|nr:hypothetical protein UVI_02046200 [Ustilaginoidea virens]
MPQIPARLDHIPHAPLELLGLGEPAVGAPVPQHPAQAPLVLDGHDKGAPRGRLQGHLAQRGGKRRQELLRELPRR